MEIDFIDKLFEYNLWSNIQLIKLCSELNEEQLEITVKGVYGKIQPTLAHTIRAEGNYIKRVTGSPPWIDEPDWDNISIGDLLIPAQLSGERLIEIAGTTDPHIQHTVSIQGKPFLFFNWTVLLQALYHAIEHRTQIRILLTELGVIHPDLSPWDFVESLMSG